MGAISLNQLRDTPPEQLRAMLQQVLSDLEDQLNSQPSVYTQGGSKFPQTKNGDIVVSTSADTISSFKVRTGKDTFATLDQDSIGVTLSTLGVSSGAEAQIRAGAITQSSLGITLTSLGVHSGAIAQITAGAITQASIGISAGAVTQITAGAIVLTGGGANSLGVTAGVAAQITSLSTLSASTLGITLTTFSVTTNFQTQITTGAPSVNGTACAAVANYASGSGTGRFRGFGSGTTSNRTTFLSVDGDWGVYLDTTTNFFYFLIRDGSGNIYGEELALNP